MVIEGFFEDEKTRGQEDEANVNTYKLKKMAKKQEYKSKVNIKNKRAEHEFILVDTYTAGIVLTGTEIKSVRAGKASLVDTYCYFVNGELWVKNMYIAHYTHGSYNNHVERRERKLLLNKKELRSLAQDIKSPGYTIVPILLHISEKGFAKVDIALAKGKKEFDKRQTLKEKEDRREMDRAYKALL